MNSNKTIIEKLSLNKYPTKLIIAKPEDLDDFNELEYDTSVNKEKYDMILTFIFSLEEYSNYLKLVIEKDLLNDKGYLFFAYPKKNNKKYAGYIDRDSFFQQVPIDEDGFVLDSNIKFARMVSLNDVFTVIGLKVENKKKRKATSTEKSQCVDDYIAHVEDIKQFLANNEEVLKTYLALTFGYQKDWARYVYSAKKKETQEKRLLEMESILADGYKSIDLFRRKIKR